MAEPVSSQPKRKRIAVIAVHGVADQSPRDSAHAIANLLLNLNRSTGHTRFTPFTEEQISVATRPVVLRRARERPAMAATRTRLQRVRSWFDQSGPEMRKRHWSANQSSARAPVEPQPGDGPHEWHMPPEHVFMRD